MDTDIFNSTKMVEADELYCEFFNVEFVKNFGPWHKGQKFDKAAIDYQEGIIHVFEGGRIVQSCNINLCPAIN